MTSCLGTYLEEPNVIGQYSNMLHGICVNYFLSFSQKNLSPEKTEKKVFTFQFLNDKIDQDTNFAKLPSAKWLFLVYVT